MANHLVTHTCGIPSLMFVAALKCSLIFSFINLESVCGPLCQAVVWKGSLLDLVIDMLSRSALLLLPTLALRMNFFTELCILHCIDENLALWQSVQARMGLCIYILCLSVRCDGLAANAFCVGRME